MKSNLTFLKKTTVKCLPNNLLASNTIIQNQWILVDSVHDKIRSTENIMSDHQIHPSDYVSMFHVLNEMKHNLISTGSTV